MQDRPDTQYVLRTFLAEYKTLMNRWNTDKERDRDTKEREREREQTELDQVLCLTNVLSSSCVSLSLFDEDFSLCLAALAFADSKILFMTRKETVPPPPKKTPTK